MEREPKKVSQSKMFESVSFEDAVRLFKQWGFIVEPGPRQEEVTLIHEGPTSRITFVQPAAELAQMTATLLRVRQQNGAVAGQVKMPAFTPMPRMGDSALLH